jgi:hypothetical protein
MPQAEFGQFSPPSSGTAAAPNATGSATVYQRRMWLYPDPYTTIYISNAAFSSTTAANVAALTPAGIGGVPMPFDGPIQPQNLYMLAASVGATASWFGQ